jgi:hypothetical protein
MLFFTCCLGMMGQQLSWNMLFRQYRTSTLSEHVFLRLIFKHLGALSVFHHPPSSHFLQAEWDTNTLGTSPPSHFFRHEGAPIYLGKCHSSHVLQVFWNPSLSEHAILQRFFKHDATPTI